MNNRLGACAHSLRFLGACGAWLLAGLGACTLLSSAAHADPITLGAGLVSGISSLIGGLGTAGGLGALGSLAGAGAAAYSAFKPGPKAPSIPAPAPPVQSPVGSQTSNASSGGPSFLAAAAAPPQNNLAGSKSLLGQ